MDDAVPCGTGELLERQIRGRSVRNSDNARGGVDGDVVALPGPNGRDRLTYLNNDHATSHPHEGG